MVECIIRAAEFDETEIITGEFREEIIRCRDCKEHEESSLCRFWSANTGIEIYGQRYTDPDGFCAWAERAD